jgi:Holliday junction resolvase RusA-like endonuclease
MVYNPKTADQWKASVAESLQEYRGVALEGRIWINLEFRMLRPKSHFGTGRNAEVLKKQAPEHHIQTPDIDNLVKSTMDAITNINLWRDDCQVDNIIARKIWVDSDPGVNLIIEQKKQQ